MIPLITVLSHPEEPGFKRLQQSAEKNGWVLHPIVTQWRGFGTKIMELKNYLEQRPEITEFVFCDAYDVIILGTPDEMKTDAKILFSAEKACYPVPALAKFYPPTESNFKYLNSGLFYARRDAWLNEIAKFPPSYEVDDQFYYTSLFITEGSDIEIDFEQKFFNSHSFVDPSEYGYHDNRVFVWYTGEVVLHQASVPLAVHFNGRTIDPEFDKNIQI